MDRAPHAHLRNLTLAMMLAAAPLSAQVILTSPNYQPGQRIALALEIETNDVRDSPPKKTYQTAVALRVVRKSTQGTYLEWVAGKSSAGSARETADPFLDMAERIFENLRLMVHLDPAGRSQGIQNVAELDTRIRQFVLLLVPQATSQIADPAARQRAAEGMRNALTPEALLSAARKEVDLFFGISGLRLEAGKRVRVKSSLLHPFGSTGTLGGEIEMIPLPVNSQTGEIRVEFRQQFDAALAANLSWSAADRSRAETNPAQKMTMDDSGEFVVDAASGHVKQVRHVRTIRRNGAALRTESTVITVQ